METLFKDTVSQERGIKEKNKYHILTHTCGIQKNGTDEPVYKEEIETYVENKRMDTKGGKWGGGVVVGGGMNWAIGIDMYTLICKKQITNKNLLY